MRSDYHSAQNTSDQVNIQYPLINLYHNQLGIVDWGGFGHGVNSDGIRNVGAI